MFDLFVFDIVFVLKCKNENGKGVSRPIPTVFNPNDDDEYGWLDAER